MTHRPPGPCRRITILELRCVTGSGGGPEKTILMSGRMADITRFKVILGYIRNTTDPAYTLPQRAEELGLQFSDLRECGKLDPRMVAELVKLIRREKVDIVHAHDYKSNLVALLLRPFFRYKLVSTTHGWVTRTPKLELYYFLEKMALRFYDKVMCVSVDQRDELVRHGIPSEKLIYLRNGVDNTRFKRRSGEKKLRIELRLRPDQPLVGGIGRLRSEKDFSTYLKVARAVTTEMPEAVFVVVGEGPDLAALGRLAQELRLDGKVMFLGQRSDMLDVYESLDLFLLTSIREGLPNVVLEAMAMELPVVATDVGGVSEIIRDGINGLLCRTGDVEGLAKAVMALLRDRDWAHQVAAAARETVCRGFSFSERVQKLEQVYLDLMGNEGKNAASPAVSTPAS